MVMEREKRMGVVRLVVKEEVGKEVEMRTMAEVVRQAVSKEVVVMKLGW